MFSMNTTASNSSLTLGSKGQESNNSSSGNGSALAGGRTENETKWGNKIVGFLGKKDFADVVFLVGPFGEEIFSHRIILSATSTVFETMFSSRWNHNSSSADPNFNGSTQGELVIENNGIIQDIQLPDVDPLAFKLFLKYCYNQCNTKSLGLNFVPVENLLDLVYVARKYDAVNLVETCLHVLQVRLDVENAIAVFQQAQDYGENFIENSAFEFIVRRLSEILETSQFNSLRQSNLSRILAIDELDIREVSLFQSACRWSKAECTRLGLPVSPENYRKVLGDALDLIRFPTMKSEDLTFQVSNCGILTPSEMVEILKFVALPLESRTNLGTLKYNVKPRQGYQNDLSLLFCRRHGTSEEIYILHNSCWFQTCFSVDHKIKLKGVGLAISFHETNSTSASAKCRQGQLNHGNGTGTGSGNGSKAVNVTDSMDVDEANCLFNSSEEPIEVNVDISQTDNQRKAFATCGKVVRGNVRLSSPSLTYIRFDEPIVIEPHVIHSMSYMFKYKQAELSHHLIALGEKELNVSPVDVRVNDLASIRFNFLVTKGNDHPYLECPIREIAFSV